MICSYTFLTIDDASIWATHQLKHRVATAIKHPEPVFGLDAPWERETDLLNYLNMIYDEEEQLFKMWYVITTQSKDQYWEGGRRTAYATSKDGIHWDRPILNLVEVNGSKQNNCIIPQMGSLTYTILHDPSDPPCRRYKMIFQVESSETRWARFHIPLNIAYSSDGIHWDRPRHVNPITRGISDAGWGFFYDADRRKYSLFTRRVPNIPRCISLYESYDLVNWEDHGIILTAGDEHDPAEMYNLQGMTPFRYGDFCLGLLNTQYSLPNAESYEVFNKPPAGYPGAERFGQLDIQLCYSRDGRRWHRPADRTPLVPNDSDDSGTIFVPSSPPITRNGETLIHYLSVRNRHSDWSQRQELDKIGWDLRQAGTFKLARVPQDRWTSLDGDADGGWLITEPWGPPLEVFVNADVEAGGSIAVEIVTPYGQPVKGYSRSECIPVTTSGMKQPIRWKIGRPPHELSHQHIGGVCLKFHVTRAKLYAYTLTLPDPDGQLERDRLNARWCESIKHRSDNWSRASTELPAGDEMRSRSLKRMKEARPYDPPKGNTP